MDRLLKLKMTLLTKVKFIKYKYTLKTEKGRLQGYMNRYSQLTTKDKEKGREYICSLLQHIVIGHLAVRKAERIMGAECN